MKTQCEELGAYTSREKVRARMIVRGAAKRAPGVEDEEEMWTLLKRCLLSTIHCLAVKYFNQRKCEGLLLLSRKTQLQRISSCLGGSLMCLVCVDANCYDTVQKLFKQSDLCSQGSPILL